MTCGCARRTANGARNGNSHLSIRCPNPTRTTLACPRNGSSSGSFFVSLAVTIVMSKRSHRRWAISSAHASATLLKGVRNAESKTTFCFIVERRTGDDTAPPLSSSRIVLQCASVQPLQEGGASRDLRSDAEDDSREPPDPPPGRGPPKHRSG